MMCENCKSEMIDILEKRIRATLRVARECSTDSEDDESEEMFSAQGQCFHFLELIQIVKGEHTTGVYDDFGEPPKPPTIDGPLFWQGATT